MSTTPSARRPRANRNAKPKSPPADTARENVEKAKGDVDMPALFRKGRTIAQIARDSKVGQDAVRAALDAAEIDYSADKNAKPAGATTPTSTSAPKGEWSLLGSFESILAKKAAPGSKRAQVIADLASDANTAGLQAIILKMNEECDRETLARMANAFTAALSAHYARV